MSLKLKMLLVILFIATLAGCAAQQHTILPDPREQYELAKSKYDDEKFDEAVIEFQKFMFNFPGVSYIDSAHFYFSMSYIKREDQFLGIAELRRLIVSFPKSEMTDDAQFMIGKSYIDVAPGNAGLDQSDTQQGIKELRAFLEDYPFSDRRKDAEKLLSQAIEKLVGKDFKTAKQYYKMGNKISSRLYLEEIVKEYPESKHAPEALYLLIKLDIKEKKFTDARDKARNLTSAFPNSKYAEKATELKAEIEKMITESELKEENEPKETSAGK